MNSSSKEDRRVRATQEAAEWAGRLQDDNLAAGEQLEFVDWLRESPVHVAELLRILEVHTSLTEFPWWKNIPAVTDFSSADVIPFVSREGQAAPTPRRYAKWVRRCAPGIGVAAAVGGAIALFIQQQVAPLVIRTQPGERREITLIDGSTVAAAPETELHIDINRDHRAIALLHGKAVFNVTKDRTRPFTVDAAQARVVAVGTIFSVEDNAHTVVVMVSEGKVAVTRKHQSAPFGPTHDGAGVVALVAHQRVAVAPTGEALTVQNVDSTPAQTWADPQIAFENQTVAGVVRRFNANNRIQIRIADPALGEVPVSGVFAASDPQSFVAFLEAATGATSLRAGPNEIVVSGQRHEPQPAGAR